MADGWEAECRGLKLMDDGNGSDEGRGGTAYGEKGWGRVPRDVRHRIGWRRTSKDGSPRPLLAAVLVRGASVSSAVVMRSAWRH